MDLKSISQIHLPANREKGGEKNSQVRTDIQYNEKDLEQESITPLSIPGNVYLTSPEKQNKITVQTARWWTQLLADIFRDVGE